MDSIPQEWGYLFREAPALQDARAGPGQTSAQV